MDNLTWSSILLSILGPLFGSGFGAWAAFECNKRTKDQAILEKQLELSKYAQFIIICHCHFIKNVWNKYLTSKLDNNNRHLELVRFDFTEKLPNFDFEKLSFILHTIDSDILYELFIYERNFLNFVDSIKTRNDFYTQFSSGKSESSGSQAFLKELTDNMYDLYARIDKRNDEISIKFLAYLKKRYPEYKHFLHTERIQTSPQAFSN